MLIQSDNQSCIITLSAMLILLQVNLCGSLNTGYNNNQPKCVKNGQLLKCSYLLSALSYMELAKLEIYHPNFILKNVYYLRSKYLVELTKMMSSLFGFEGVEIGSLWLMNVYLSIVCSIVDKFMHLNSFDQHLDTYLKDSHDYVIDVINSEVSVMKCKKNKFHVYEKELNELKTQSLENLHKVMINKTRFMHIFILRNTDLSILNFQNFRKRNIFIRNIGSKDHYLAKFMNDYNVQVNWKATSKSTMQQLQENYENAHKIDWTKNRLSGIEIYFDSIFSFFKIIMLRLTWKHFLYVEKQENTFDKNDLIENWLKLLNDFAKFLHLKDDDFVYKIIHTIGIQGTVDDYILKCYLNTLCCDLHCNALEEMKLDGKEFAFKKDTKPVHNETELKTVEYYSLGAAKDFIDKIKGLFVNSDFNFVKSFIDYAENNKLFFQTEKPIKYLFSLSDM